MGVKCVSKLSRKRCSVQVADPSDHLIRGSDGEGDPQCHNHATPGGRTVVPGVEWFRAEANKKTREKKFHR
jgi:hypothetical protein